MRLGKFASSIERVTLRLSDVNGPKGGVDHKCLIKVVLSGLPSVVVERRDSALQRAVNTTILGACFDAARVEGARQLRLAALDDATAARANLGRMPIYAGTGAGVGGTAVRGIPAAA